MRDDALDEQQLYLSYLFSKFDDKCLLGSIQNYSQTRRALNPWSGPTANLKSVETIDQ